MQLIAATTTKTGPRVEAQPDVGTYLTGLKVTDADMASLKIEPDTFHGEWNCTLNS